MQNIENDYKELWKGKKPFEVKLWQDSSYMRDLVLNQKVLDEYPLVVLVDSVYQSINYSFDEDSGGHLEHRSIIVNHDSMREIFSDTGFEDGISNLINRNVFFSSYGLQKPNKATMEGSYERGFTSEEDFLKSEAVIHDLMLREAVKETILK